MLKDLPLLFIHNIRSRFEVMEYILLTNEKSDMYFENLSTFFSKSDQSNPFLPYSA